MPAQVFLRDVSYPRINHRRTARFLIKRLHSLNHLRNLTIPKPFLVTVALNYPGIRLLLGRRLVSRESPLPFHQLGIGKYMVETLVVVEKRNTKTADVVIERDSDGSSRRVASFRYVSD